MLVRTFCMLVLSASVLCAQTGDSLQRAAAVRFAIATGMEFAPGVVVAVETISDSANPRPPASRVEMRSQDAAQIAAVIGAKARTSSIATLVRCERRSCWAATDTPVLVVGDPETTRDGQWVVVGLTYCASGIVAGQTVGRRTMAVVRLSRDGNGWVGSAFNNGPTTVTQQR